MIKKIYPNQLIPNSIAYISVLNQVKSPGVIKKIKGTLNGAEQNNMITRLLVIPFEDNPFKKLRQAIKDSPESILLIRSVCQYNFLLIPELWAARNKGQKVILDVPTPNRVAIYEIAKSKTSLLSKCKELIFLLVSGPIPYWFCDRIIQYADEGSWFLMGNRSKTLLMGNGIDVDQIPFRNISPFWPAERLNLIAVASINYWHGFDRLLKAVATFNLQEESTYKVHLCIVGDGPVLKDLEEMVTSLDIKEFVEFSGFLSGNELYEKFDSAHLAVGSLGLFRKKLNMASELKSREYCAVGIPFIASGTDPDFPKEIHFRKEIENIDGTEGLISLFKNFTDFYMKIESQEIRKYAENHLDFKSKFKQMVQRLT